MKKFINIICCMLLAVCMTLTLSACGGNNPDSDLVTITLNEMNGKPTQTVRVHKGVTIPGGSAFSNWPTRYEWFFDAWYLDEECSTLAEGHIVNEDMTIYAGWKDHKVIPHYNSYPEPYNTLFDADIVVTYNANSGIVNLSGSIKAIGDMTGELSNETIEVSVRYDWLSDEMFMDQYVSDEVSCWTSFRFTLSKEDNFTMENINASFNRYSTERPNISASIENIYSGGFVTGRHTSYISVISGEQGSPTIQYNHNK